MWTRCIATTRNKLVLQPFLLNNTGELAPEQQAVLDFHVATEVLLTLAHHANLVLIIIYLFNIL